MVKWYFRSHLRLHGHQHWRLNFCCCPPDGHRGFVVLGDEQADLRTEELCQGVDRLGRLSCKHSIRMLLSEIILSHYDCNVAKN